MKDTIVVGYGPCGISCAIYLRRYGNDVLVLGKDGGALEKVSNIENYYGISSISGPDLLKQGLKQAHSLGIEVRTQEEVLSIEAIDGGFEVVTSVGRYPTRTVMLACGTSRNQWQLGKRFEGYGVSYCATCDGFLYRKKKVALVGSGALMKHELEVLKNLCPDVTVFTDGKPLEGEISPEVKVVPEKITELFGSEKLEGIRTESQSYDIDGCFVALGSASAFTFAKHLGMQTEGNRLVVDDHFQTNIPGIYAGGDTIGGLLQVSKAVSDGALAATAISQFLREKK